MDEKMIKKLNAVLRAIDSDPRNYSHEQKFKHFYQEGKRGGLEKFKNYESNIEVEQETFRNIITGKIYQLLSRENINKKQLADKLNISKAAVTSMLSGDRNFTIDNLTKITSVIGYIPIILFKKKNHCLSGLIITTHPERAEVKRF
jgi:DNA-binding Xre family transcriptional regulator